MGETELEKKIVSWVIDSSKNLKSGYDIYYMFDEDFVEFALKTINGRSICKTWVSLMYSLSGLADSFGCNLSWSTNFIWSSHNNKGWLRLYKK